MQIHKTRISDWINYYQCIGLPEDVYGQYLPYIETLLSRNLPVILDFTHLAGLLGRTNGYLASVVNSPKNHYRTFTIPKKSGGIRKIEAPYPALKECQSWIYVNILSKVKLHRDVHGFRPRRSIITNATRHIGCKELLNVDIKDFFPSISIRRVIKVFVDLGYSGHVSFFLASICCVNNRLSQGAPTSPVLSNIVAKGLDVRLSRLASSNKLSYSRYADDISFSGDRVPHWIIDPVTKIISDCGFVLNEAKTRLANKKANRRIVTGIDVKEDGLSLPRPYRRSLRQDLHYIEEHGLQGHLARKRIRDPEYLNRLIGRLNYWKQIEPESEYVNTKLRYLRKLF